MGFDSNCTRFLVQSRQAGVDFSHCATIGHQQLILTRYDLKKTLERCGFREPEETLTRIFGADSIDSGTAWPFADAFLEYLGTRELTTFDASPYEKASVIHDMNEPIPEEHHNRFSVVIDGGSLEHVFHFPTAIANCMKMVRVGGHFLATNPCNNLMGHGFYQFSPELYFSLFTPEHGFEVEVVLVHETVLGAKLYQVAEPRQIHRRVELANTAPTNMLIRAKKIADVRPLRLRIQQSDYQEAWQKSQVSGASIKPSPWLQAVKPWLPYWAVRFAYRLRNLLRSKYPAPQYRPYET